MLSLNYGGDSAITVERCDLPIKVKDIEFVQGTQTGADGDIFFIFISDSAVIPHPAFNVVLRTTFNDAN